MNYQNENTNYAKEVIEIANNYKEMQLQKGIDIGDFEVQIVDSNFDIAVGFSNGYKLILKLDKISDFARSHKSFLEALVGSNLVKI
jgi:hypothetical protein